MWEAILGIGIIFLILEIVVPSMFFINFAFASVICAALSLKIHSIPILITIFAALSLASLYLLKPILMNLKATKGKDKETGVNSTYIGKTATITEKTDSENGAITIYDERWQARSLNGELIENGEKVIIKKLDGLIAYVEKKEN